MPADGLGLEQPLTRDTARLAFLLFLGRAPENEDVLRYAMSFGTLARLRAALLASDEFEFLLNRRARVVGADAPPLAVAWQTDDATARHLLARVRAVWADVPPGPLGDGGAGRDPDGSLRAGELLATLARNGLDPDRLPRGFQFGCADGRVGRHLRGRFAVWAGCDLAPLRLAAAEAAGLGELAPIDDPTLGMLAPFDLWYSHLTLQVLPPPLIARALARALRLLLPGGVAVFQLPTYGCGYRFDAAEAPRADPALERHVLPQPVVHALAAQAGCETLEVFEDLAVAPARLWRSSVFVLRKTARG